MWDFSIQTDNVKEPQRLGLPLVDKKSRTCKIIDSAVPEDSRIEEKKKREDRRVSRSKNIWIYRRFGMLE